MSRMRRNSRVSAMNCARSSSIDLMVSLVMGGSPTHWKNLMPFSLSRSSRWRYSLMKFYSFLVSFWFFRVRGRVTLPSSVASLVISGSISPFGSTEKDCCFLLPLSAFSGIFSSLTPARDEVLIASFLLVSSVLVLVFFTSYYWSCSITGGCPSFYSLTFCLVGSAFPTIRHSLGFISNSEVRNCNSHSAVV